MSKERPDQDILSRMVAVIARYDGVTAGKAGCELWWDDGNKIRTENTCATMHCRAAGKLLARAERAGLVRYKQHGPAKLWYVTARGKATP